MIVLPTGYVQVDVTALRAERDSLAAVVAAQASLAEENRRLRQLLGLRGRAPRSFVPAELVRIGTPGGESTFLLNVGTENGVRVGSPVIASGGVGSVEEIRTALRIHVAPSLTPEASVDAALELLLPLAKRRDRTKDAPQSLSRQIRRSSKIMVAQVPDVAHG